MALTGHVPVGPQQSRTRAARSRRWSRSMRRCCSPFCTCRARSISPIRKACSRDHRYRRGPAASASTASAAQAQQPKPKEKEGGSAPKNIKSEATPVVAPKPRIDTPPVQQIAATRNAAPGHGADAGRIRRSRAGHRRGRDRHRHRQRPAATARAAAVTAASPSRRTSSRRCSAAATSRATCSTNGRAARPCSCACGSTRAAMSANAPSIAERAVRRSTPTLCNLAHERLRFRPALNRSGQAVAGWFGYAQPAPR